MGKRSRRRFSAPPGQAGSGVNRQPGAASKATDSTSQQAISRPAAPWGAFPLTEIAVAIGLGMLVGGFVAGGQAGTVILVTGMALCSLAGFEQALREHRCGYKSHSAVLAGVPAAVTVGVLALAGVAPKFFAPAAIGVAIAAWLPIRASYSNRS